MKRNDECSCTVKAIIALFFIVTLAIYFLCSCSVQRIQYCKECSRFPISKLDSVCEANGVPTSLEDWQSYCVSRDSVSVTRYYLVEVLLDCSERIYTIEVSDSTFLFTDTMSEAVKEVCHDWVNSIK